MSDPGVPPVTPLLSFKCRTYGDRDHAPCSGWIDDGTERPCGCWCHGGTELQRTRQIGTLAYLIYTQPWRALKNRQRRRQLAALLREWDEEGTP